MNVENPSLAIAVSKNKKLSSQTKTICKDSITK